MASINETLTKVAGKLLVANGHNSDGTTKTMAVNFPTLNPTAYDATKFTAMGDEIEQMVGSTALYRYATKTYEVEEE